MDFSLLWFAFLIIVCIAYVVHKVATSEYNFVECLLYLPTYLMGRLLWRVHFTNSPPVEIQSGAVLAANHRSSVDPFFVQLAARRRVHWMVAKEYCNHFIFGAILKPLQVIPTNRSGMDVTSTRHAMQLTQAGKLVGMFPEGRLNKSKEPLLTIRAGAALVAARSQVPIIPLYIQGSPYRRTVWSPLFMPARVTITFGEPVYPTSEESVTGELSATDETIVKWGRQVAKLAGCPEFVVRLSQQRKSTRAGSI